MREERWWLAVTMGAAFGFSLACVVFLVIA
jgi:hypothetical protein